MVQRVLQEKPMNEFKVGDKVAWMMLDNNLMAGTITDVNYTTLVIKRVDGGICTLFKNNTTIRAATDADILEAIKFFQEPNQ